MRSLSSVGLALTIVFGCLLLALLAELYYLLCCKKRSTTTNDYSTPKTKELLFILCCNTNTNLSPSSSFSNPKPIETPSDSNVEFVNVGLGLVPFVPRFLFTIMEETAEEIEPDEEEDGVSIKGKSLNDLFLNIESPYLTPLASPSLFMSPFKKDETFFDLSTDAEFNKLVRSSYSPSSTASPLSRFKFLRDAEEKLYKRKVMEIVEAEEESKRLN